MGTGFMGAGDHRSFLGHYISIRRPEALEVAFSVAGSNFHGWLRPFLAIDLTFELVQSESTWGPIPCSSQVFDASGISPVVIPGTKTPLRQGSYACNTQSVGFCFNFASGLRGNSLLLASPCG